MSNAIDLSHLYFSYNNENYLFEDLSLSFAKGKMHGLLGPNGAGKSTLIKLISGLLLPHQGEVKIWDNSVEHDTSIFGKSIGLLSDHAPLYLNMTVYEYLSYCAVLKNIPKKNLKARLAFLMDKLQLHAVAHHFLKTLSTGFRQRVALAQALVHDPAILILDEPTSGLDPQSSANFREILNELKNDHTIIFSSHQLHEVESLCDDVTMVYHGKILFHGALSAALSQNKKNQYSLTVKQDKKWNLAEWQKYFSCKLTAVKHLGLYCHLEFALENEDEINSILSNLVSKKISIIELTTQKHDLEEKFLHLVKNASITL